MFLSLSLQNIQKYTVIARGAKLLRVIAAVWLCIREWNECFLSKELLSSMEASRLVSSLGTTAMKMSLSFLFPNFDS